MTNEIASVIQSATDALRQVQSWPVAILIIAVLIVLGGALKVVSAFPNKYIPIAVLLCGSLGNAMLGDLESVKAARHPLAVLALQGFIFGFAAWTLHHFLLRRFEKFIPLLAGKTGDTQIIDKKDQ